jgi:hypothetical protein
LTGLLAGIAYPFVDLALSCRAPASEACVWGKAYLPLTIGASLVIVGGTATALVYVLLQRRSRSKKNDD